jgi:hypothetical protein
MILVHDIPSAYNGKPIRVRATFAEPRTANEKTGAMIQTYIAPAFDHPQETIKQGDDGAQCGACPLSPTAKDKVSHDSSYTNVGQIGQTGGGCYIRTDTIGHTLSDKDNSKVVLKALDKGYGLRLGSYGDPAMVDPSVWKPLLDKASFHTGYTHQWRHDFAQKYKGILMASVNSPSEFLEAKKLGWKVFATWNGICAEHVQVLGLTIQCPSDPTLPVIRQCSACRLCNGKRADIWIVPHGSRKKYLPTYTLEDCKLALNALIQKKEPAIV